MGSIDIGPYKGLFSMVDRFYTPTALTEQSVVLEGGEAHHLIHVLRKEVGRQVHLFDGRGGEATAEIVSLSSSTAELKILETRPSPGASRCQIVLGTAAPKGDRFRWLVEKTAELGVARLVPLKTEYSVVHPSAGKLEKLRQTVVAACKQSGCNRLMQIDECIGWSEFVVSEAASGVLLVAHPAAADSIEAALSSQRQPRPLSSITLAIGPEGGWTDAEIETAVEAGARLVSLGANTLRIETAAVALAAYVALRGSLD